MKIVKIALLLVIAFARNGVFAGGGKKKIIAIKHVNPIESDALQYLKRAVKIVSPETDISMSEKQFNEFLRKIKRSEDDETILRNYFSRWRNSDVLYNQCYLPHEGEMAQEEITLRDLLQTIRDQDVKKAIINKVIGHSINRERMLINTPRGPQGKPKYNLEVIDNREDMIKAILSLANKNN